MTSAIPFSSVLRWPPACTSRAYVTAQNLHKTVDRAFITALLLTANAERAEAAILNGTRVMDLDDTPGDALLRATVNAALEPQREASERTPEQLERASSMLPLELRRVLHLSTDLRHCFVLRVLMGLPRQACARLLRLDDGQIDERTCTAMLELPAIERQKSLTNRQAGPRLIGIGS